MQVSSNTSSLAHSNYALLRWFEGSQGQPREEFVEVVNDQLSHTVIRSSLKLNQETAVTLIGKDYTEEGVVQGCQSEDAWFLLTVVGKLANRDVCFVPDPGVFAVDGFLSEEQEAAILREFDGQSMSGLEPPSGSDRPVRQCI